MRLLIIDGIKKSSFVFSFLGKIFVFSYESEMLVRVSHLPVVKKKEKKKKRVSHLPPKLLRSIKIYCQNLATGKIIIYSES